ncbi:MAG: DUF499 domain-containing protein [Thermosphaera sp.]
MTTSSIKPFTSVLRPHKEVLEGNIVENLRLSDIYLYNELRDRVEEARSLQDNPLLNHVEFLKRTYVSNSMKRVILKVMGGLAGASSLYVGEEGKRFNIGSRVLIIPSYLGGGKTHLLATLYYIAKLYNERGVGVAKFVGNDEELQRGLKHAIDGLGGAKIHVVAIVGDTKALAPSPKEPVVIDGVKIYTPWGLLGFLLGEYESVREADELHYTPRVDVLRKILRGKRVLILVDEAVEYVTHAVRIDSEHSGYSRNFLSFLRDLAEAVNDTPGTVLVVTLPAEYREGFIAKGYQHPEYVYNIDQMLRRVGPEYIPPLEFKKDIAEVFKKRLFENAYSRESAEQAFHISNAFKEKVSKDTGFEQSVKAKYGSPDELQKKVEETYPFHPYFIEIIVNIAARNPELGLTRNLLAYTARLLRHLYSLRNQRGRDPLVSLITPWLIPLDVQEFRTELTHGLMAQLEADLNRIYEQDVKRYSELVEQYIWTTEAQLSREKLLNLVKGALARTIWIATIPGGGGKGSDVLKYYPVKNHYPVIVYDPLAMRDAPSADVANSIDELMNSSTYLTIYDGRVFYAAMPDLAAIIRQRYLDATDFDALRRLENFVNQQSFKPGRKIRRVFPINTDRVRDIEESVETEVSRTSDPVLFIYLGLADPPEELVDIVLKRNNVVLLLPEYSAVPSSLGLFYTEKYRRIIGPEPSNTRDYIKNLLKLLKVVSEMRSEKEYLERVVGREYLDHVLNTLRTMQDELEKQLATSLFTVLKKVVAGSRKSVFNVDLRPVGEEGVDLSSLVRLLEGVLERRGVPLSWTWSGIYDQLKDWEALWDVDYSLKKPIRIGDMWSQLLYSSKVKPHLTSFADFKEALKDAYSNNLLAFKYGSTILWLKHPYTSEQASELLKTKLAGGGLLHDWERDVELELERMRVELVDLEAVSPRMVVREYVEQLRRKAEVKPGERVVRRLTVYTPEGPRDFNEFIARFRSESDLVDALSKNPVVLEEETPPHVFTPRILRVGGQVFQDKPVELVADDEVRVRVEGVVESDEKALPARVVLEAKSLDGRVVGEDVKNVKTGESFAAEVALRGAGEYMVLVRAEDPKGSYRSPPVHVATVRVKGVVCMERLEDPVKMRERVETAHPAGEISIVELIIKGSLKKGVVPVLAELLSEASKHGVVASGEVKVGAGSEEFHVVFKNAGARKLSQVIASLGVEGDVVDVDIKLTGLTVSALKSSAAIRNKLADPFTPLVSISRFKIRECRRV